MSFDSGQRPLTHVRYQSANANPYGSGDPYYNGTGNQSSGFLPPQKPNKGGLSPWIKFGVPVGILVIIGAVVGAVVGTRNHNSSSSSNAAAAASSAVGAKTSVGVFAVSTNSEWMLPVYPTTVSKILLKSIFMLISFLSSDKHCGLYNPDLCRHDRFEIRVAEGPLPALQPEPHVSTQRSPSTHRSLVQVASASHTHSERPISSGVEQDYFRKCHRVEWHGPCSLLLGWR